MQDCSPVIVVESVLLAEEGAFMQSALSHRFEDYVCCVAFFSSCPLPRSAAGGGEEGKEANTPLALFWFVFVLCLDEVFLLVFSLPHPSYSSLDLATVAVY